MAQASVIVDLIRRTFISDQNIRIQAEQSLNQLQLDPLFPLILLEILKSKDAYEAFVFVSASILLKNYLKQHWPEDPQTSIIKYRIEIKQNIIQVLLMAHSPSVQDQMIEAIVQIVNLDFPNEWSNLIPDLCSLLNLGDMNLVLVAFKLVYHITKRYKSAFRSDELFMEIKLVLTQFSPLLLEMYKITNDLIQVNQGNDKLLIEACQVQLYSNKIFYALSTQDIPEYFEDHLDAFTKYQLEQLSLASTNKDLISTDSHANDGKNENLKGKSKTINTEEWKRNENNDNDHEDDEETSNKYFHIMEKNLTIIIKIATIYASKYEEEFDSYLSRYIQMIWNILAQLPSNRKRHDKLSSKGMEFLSIIAKQPKHHEIFGGKENLSIICNKIIIPNMIQRNVDLEILQDEPLEYVRLEMAGSSAFCLDLRRESAMNFIRSLMEFHEKALIENLYTLSNNLIIQFNEGGGGSYWKEKDLAIALFSAISIKSYNTHQGITRINTDMDIETFYRKNILPELQIGEANHPLLKVDALRFLILFRNYLCRTDIQNIFPLIVHHLTSSNTLINTFSSIAIDKLLSLELEGGGERDGKDGRMGMKAKRENFLLQKDENYEELIQKLLNSINPKSSGRIVENEFVAKTLVHAIMICPFISARLESRLSNILSIIIQNIPTNSKFTHLIFESIGMMIKKEKSISMDYNRNGLNSSISFTFSNLFAILFPFYQQILQGGQRGDGLQEFYPYVFQLLAAHILGREERGQVAGGGDGMMNLQIKGIFDSILQPALWNISANVPALTLFLQSVILRSDSMIIMDKSEIINTLFGIAQTLINSRQTDIHGYSLMNVILMKFKPSALESSYLQAIFIMILKRLQSCKTFAGSLGLLNIMSNMSATMTPSFVFNLFESIQPGLIIGLMKSVLLVDFKKIRIKRDKLMLQISLSRFIGECPELLLISTENVNNLNYQSLWISILDALITSLSGGGGRKMGILNSSLTIKSSLPHEKERNIAIANDRIIEEEGRLQMLLEEGQESSFSFSKLSSISLDEEIKYSDLFSSITDNTKYLIDQLVMASQRNNRELVINLITNGLDSTRLEWLQKQMQSYSISL